MQSQRRKKTKLDIEQMAKNCTGSKEDAAKVIHEFEEIIKKIKSNIVWLAYHQGQR